MVGLSSPKDGRGPAGVLVDRHASFFALELLPRITRAQSMDALSSQAMVAGYRAGLIAAERLPRFFPLLMTAAGTVPPAKVVVLGAGVAGLQAIATAKRLGAVVEAYDVRAAAAEEIRSLGAKAITLDIESQTSASGGYASEQAADAADRQRKALAPYIAAADAVITTAAVPGRPAPLLVTAEMVGKMRPGSVLVDLAAENPTAATASVAARRGSAAPRRAGPRRAATSPASSPRTPPGCTARTWRPSSWPCCQDGVLLSTPEDIAGRRARRRLLRAAEG